ncbi:MAG TPA: response regulator [Thermomicrobiales bacterium]|jgi:CheY-like chemotaxis protein
MPIARRAILLAEDDPDIADMISECLQGEGYTVAVAEHAAAALAALNRRDFALVLTDAFANHGPGIGQWAAVEQIRRAAGATPTVLCTAHRSQDFSDFAARGFAAILAKPFDLDDLLSLVHRLIGPAGRPHPDDSRRAE